MTSRVYGIVSIREPVAIRAHPWYRIVYYYLFTFLFIVISIVIFSNIFSDFDIFIVTHHRFEVLSC